jgi:hypothetical protein
MACPWALDGGDALQVCSVAVNILNKKSTADMGWSSSLGWARGQQLLTVRNKLFIDLRESYQQLKG